MTLRPALLVVLTVVCASLGAAPQAPSRAFVHASRVALRVQPSRTALVVGYLTTNTEVEVQTRTGEWCGVRVAAVPAPGFIACSLLGDNRLTLEEIDARILTFGENVPERLDWVARGFWASPSLRRFEDTGYGLEHLLAHGFIGNMEMLENSRKRPRHGEFDAMKAYLEKGITVTAALPAKRDWEYDQEPLQRAMKQAALPQVRASYFREREPLLAIALRPFTLAWAEEFGVSLSDALSEANRVPFRTRVTAPLGYSHVGPVGIWDISAVSVTFDHEVALHGITARGEPTGLRIKSLTMPVGSQPCVGSKMGLIARPMSNWNSAIVAWVAPSAPAGQGVVTVQQLGGSGKLDKVTIESVDIDRDTVPDFSIWSGLTPSEIQDNVDLFWKAVYANVQGQWVLLTYHQSADCT